MQTRMQKMPYKHIAAHLKKTELACRLHYHQLSHGSHRRKRTGSTSTASSTSSSSSKYSPTQFPLPGHDDLGTPLGSSPNGYGSVSPSRYGMNASPGRPQHKVLLPKPRMTPDDSPNRIHGLRINTAASMMHAVPVDTDRLQAIYNSHRSSFWESIAAEYGSDVSPAQLEDIWRQGLNMARRPPTPEESPNSRLGYPTLKPSPFPNFHTPVSANLDKHKDYSTMGHPAFATDRLPFPMATPTSTTSFDHGPLPGLGRSSSWSNASGVPATAITALLTENKCPRHSDYCVGGHCNHC